MREAKYLKCVVRVKEGQLARARQEVCAAALAPGNGATLNTLRDVTRRPPALIEPFDQEDLAFEPAIPVQLNAKIFTDCLRTSPKGSSGALSGTRYEFLKLALDDDKILGSMVCLLYTSDAADE